MSTWINTIARKRKLYCNMPSQAELHTPGFLTATLASALLGRHGVGNAQYEAIVHDILARNKYIMTPDYKMKMLHIEVGWLLTLPDAVSKSARLNSPLLDHLTYLLWYAVPCLHHKFLSASQQSVKASSFTSLLGQLRYAACNSELVLDSFALAKAVWHELRRQLPG